MCDKPNLDNIFKSYLGYCDLQGLCNSFDYFERLQNHYPLPFMRETKLFKPFQIDENYPFS